MTACASQGRDEVFLIFVLRERTICNPGQNRSPLGCSLDQIPLSIGSWRLEILFYSPNCVIEVILYTDAVAVPTGYFRGVSAKRDRLSGVSLRRAKAESLLTTKLARHDVRATAPLPSPVSHVRRCPRLQAIWPHLCPSQCRILDEDENRSSIREGATRPPEEHNSAMSDRYWGPCRPSGL